MLMNYLKSLAWTFGILFASTILVTIFNYFNILNGTFLKILFLIIPIISIFIGSYKLGKVSNKKGYIEGLKYGGIISFLFLIFNLITKNVTVTGVIYLIILLLVSVVSSILGINKRAKA